jgi:phage repressor protein C with HTH and peptisase S24 domain
MLPQFAAGRLILATGLYRRLQSGDIVIFKHEGLEKLKRIERIEKGRVYLLGLNPASSTDSRHFGHIDIKDISAKVIHLSTDTFRFWR